MKLHEDKTLFRQAIQFTSDQLQILPVYVEKDYWVTFALHTIFHSPAGTDAVFKGGTALSKCFDLIERFSEDIDLVVIRREGESNNKLTSKIKALSEVVANALPEILVPGLTQKMGMNRKTVHSYTKEFQGNFGQVRDAIVVEATWLGHSELYTTKPINSFIGNMMRERNQTSIAENNGLFPFDVRVLEPSRTICEKIMSLVRFSYGDTPIDDLKRKIRHVYDLHQLLSQESFAAFLDSRAFAVMLLKVASDDINSYKNNNQWLNNHPGDALLFRTPDLVWNDLRSTYLTEFRSLVYGTLPDDNLVLETLYRIQHRLALVDWEGIKAGK